LSIGLFCGFAFEETSTTHYLLVSLVDANIHFLCIHNKTEKSLLLGPIQPVFFEGLVAFYFIRQTGMFVSLLIASVTLKLF
jgi:hypothetical protein